MADRRGYRGGRGRVLSGCVLAIAGLVLGVAGAGCSGVTARNTASVLGRGAPERHGGAPSTPPVPAAAPPPGLPVVSYAPPPSGFPPDPDPMSTEPLAQGLHPITVVTGYDAPGGRPLVSFEPTMSGVPLTMPIAARQPGWVAVLLPSHNRTLAWVPVDGGWVTVPLPDELVVYRQSHRLFWWHEGMLMRSWPVTLGAPTEPTPLGRTYILGRSRLPGEVYADTDVFALAAVPDDPNSVPTGLRGAHIGLHTWENDWTLGQNVTDGCIRLTKSGQQLLLQELVPGTELVVLDDRRPVTSGRVDARHARV